MAAQRAILAKRKKAWNVKLKCNYGFMVIEDIEKNALDGIRYSMPRLVPALSGGAPEARKNLEDRIESQMESGKIRRRVVIEPDRARNPRSGQHEIDTRTRAVFDSKITRDDDFDIRCLSRSETDCAPAHFDQISNNARWHHTDGSMVAGERGPFMHTQGENDLSAQAPVLGRTGRTRVICGRTW